MKVGFIGTGLMGSRMAARLLASQHDLLVWNRTKEKAQPLIDKGATWVNSAPELASQVDVLFTMLADPIAVGAVAFGPEGFLNSIKEGAIWVDCSTVNPEFSGMENEMSMKKGVKFLDAPVAGTIGPAEHGELISMVGGNSEDLEKVKPLILTWSKEIIYVGDVAAGASMKMVINALLGVNMAVFSEVIRFGKTMGIDEDLLYKTIFDSAVIPPFLKFKEENMRSDKYPVAFPLKLMHKDLYLATKTAYHKDVAMPIINFIKDIFAMGKERGYGDLDFSAIYKIYNTK